MLRRAARESAVVRLVIGFLLATVALDLLATVLTGHIAVFFTPWVLAYLGILLVGFARGASWARDPVIPTVGRAPDAVVQVVGDARITSRTVRLPIDRLLADALMNDARRRSREGRAWVLIGSCFILGAALFVAVQASDALLFAGALLAVFVPAAMIWVLAGPPTSADAERGEMYRSEGPVRLEWSLSRGGRSWSVRVGDRTLQAWDDVGLRLANMPWGVVDYTESGRIMRVRDIDGNTVYELRSPPDALVTHWVLWVGPLLLVGWAVLSVVVRAAR